MTVPQEQATMVALSPGEGDFYAFHLAQLNQSNPVRLAADVFNHKGVMLAPKGTALDKAAADKLLSHQLARPLEQTVDVAGVLDNAELYAETRTILRRYPDLYQLHIALRFESDLKATLIDMDIHPWVLQQLTVLKQCLPQWFEKAVFGAWLAGLVVREMSLGQPMIDAALIAGWTHDVGFLRIDPAVLFKKGRLEPEEWRVLQSHVITGQRFLLAVPDLDPQVPSAVREHHERCDGTGYPDGRTCRQLGLLGKVIGMADSVLAIRVNQFKGTGRTLRDVLPYLQMNDVTHSLEVYRAMSSILKKSNLKPVHINPYGGIRAMAEVVHRRSTAIHEVRKHLILFQRALLEQARGSRPCKVANVLMMSINNVLTKTAAAGLEGDETLSWLAGIQDGEDDVLPDLNELELAENELLWHIQSLLRAADNYFDSEAGGGGGIAKMKNIAAGVRDALAQAKAAGRK